MQLRRYGNFGTFVNKIIYGLQVIFLHHIAQYKVDYISWKVTKIKSFLQWNLPLEGFWLTVQQWRQLLSSAESREHKPDFGTTSCTHHLPNTPEKRTAYFRGSSLEGVTAHANVYLMLTSLSCLSMAAALRSSEATSNIMWFGRSNTLSHSTPLCEGTYIYMSLIIHEMLRKTRQGNTTQQKDKATRPKQLFLCTPLDGGVEVVLPQFSEFGSV